MTITVSVSIDVPSLAEGIAFYSGAFGFTVKAQPLPTVADSGGDETTSRCSV